VSESFEQVAADDPRALELYRAYMRYVAETLELPVPEPATVSAGLTPPGGALLLARVEGVPAAIRRGP
jgi:hypothetical protein